jgi:UDP-N-acetylglucosamine--dolichyl-phosphate N-acetylglucosaminephosphotransferase|tara:strand:+ start:328 stop:597 length:270 start_codon:yes stop_codon:yes gene_type:complete
MLGRAIVAVLGALHLASFEAVADPMGGAEDLVQMSNLTLINLALVWFGPCREDALCSRLLLLQMLAVLCAIGLSFLLATPCSGAKYACT